MAQHKSAEKRARTSARREARNKALISRMRTAMKRVTGSTDPQMAATEFRKTTKLLDQLAAKGIIHRRSAANSKSRLARHVNRLK
jgi:small subunit ribosomal protein S20